MSNRLIGIRAKIERAKYHIGQLEITFQACRANLHQIRVETDTQTGSKCHRIYFSPIPPIIPLIIGDAIHNLRSSLDHLVWQLVEAHGKTPGTQTCFPFFKSASEYKAHAPGKVKGVDPRAKAIIDALKPYKGGNDDLWSIHNLDRIDKHRLMLVTHVALTAIVIGGSIAEQNETLQRMSRQMINSIGAPTLPGVPPGPRNLFILKDGAVLPFTTAGISEPNDNLNVAVEIAFGEDEAVYRKPVIPFLHQLASLVDGIVNQFASLL